MGDVVAQIAGRIDQRRDCATAICKGGAIECGRLAIQVDGYAGRWVEKTIKEDISACNRSNGSVSANAEWIMARADLEN